MVWENLGYMVQSVSFFGMGVIFGVIGILATMTKSITKDQDVWALLFSSLAWLFALMIPEMFLSTTLFLIGCIGLFFAYTGLLKLLQSTNIFVIAIIAWGIYTVLLIGTGAYTTDLAWATSYEQTQSDIATVVAGISPWGSTVDDISSHGLCNPILGSGLCENSIIKAVFNLGIFDYIASFFNILGYIGKAVKFAGMAVMAPFILRNVLITYVENTIIYNIMMLMYQLFNIVILYNIIKFVLAKRGY